MNGIKNSLAGKTLFITGASRGIGLEIALRAARDGANVVIAAKTTEPHPKLPGTIYTAAEAVEQAGGKALALVLDVRDEERVKAAVAQAAEHFGGIDACINNASAINLAKSEDIDLKRFDLIQQINMRGTFVTSRACIPYLRQSSNPHILALSPPLTLRADWFAQHLPYTMSKYGMSMVMFGLAEELREACIACNAPCADWLLPTRLASTLSSSPRFCDTCACICMVVCKPPSVFFHRSWASRYIWSPLTVAAYCSGYRRANSRSRFVTS